MLQSAFTNFNLFISYFYTNHLVTSFSLLTRPTQCKPSFKCDVHLWFVSCDPNIWPLAETYHVSMCKCLILTLVFYCLCFCNYCSSVPVACHPKLYISKPFLMYNRQLNFCSVISTVMTNKTSVFWKFHSVDKLVWINIVWLTLIQYIIKTEGGWILKTTNFMYLHPTK
jgi:hypothetical protein